MLTVFFCSSSCYCRYRQQRQCILPHHDFHQQVCAVILPATDAVALWAFCAGAATIARTTVLFPQQKRGVFYPAEIHDFALTGSANGIMRPTKFVVGRGDMRVCNGYREAVPAAVIIAAIHARADI